MKNDNIFDKTKYDNTYIKNHYDRINLLFIKGTKDKLNKHCKEYGYKSISSFVNEAINDRIKLDIENKNNCE